MLSELLAGTTVVFLTLALNRLLKGVDQNHAVVMVIVGGVLPAAIDFVNVLNDAAALMLVRGTDFLSCSTSLSGTLWPCCSSVSIARSSWPPSFSGVSGFSLWGCSCTDHASAPFPGRLADRQRFRQCDPQPHGLTAAAIRGHALERRFPRPPGGDRNHVVASDQGGPAAGRRSLIAGWPGGMKNENGRESWRL